MHCLYFPPEVGGLESHVHDLCRGLVERGHEVDVVTSRSVSGTPAEERIDGIRVWRTFMPARNAAGWASHSVLSARRLGSVARDANVVHAQAFASVLPCAVARRRSGAKLVATFHTSHFLRRASRPAWRPLLRWMVRTADYRLAASREIARVTRELTGDPVEALVNGVDTRRFRRVEGTLERGGRKRMLVPRRLFEKNGVEFAVRAIPYISEHVDVEAVVVGDGPERGRLEQLARALDVEDRVLFMGSRARDEMPGLLSSGDVAVFPSLVEATSVAALESMACELPVAASRVGGLPEIVDEDVGALFEPRDPRALADAVVLLFQRPDLDQVGDRARARVVERWSNDRLVERHLEIYRNLVERQARGA